MFSKACLSTFAASALALGLSAAAHAAPVVGADVKSAVVGATAPEASVQNVYWRRDYGWRRHHWHHRYYGRRW